MSLHDILSKIHAKLVVEFTRGTVYEIDYQFFMGNCS